jgi:hypothetical protein
MGDRVAGLTILLLGEGGREEGRERGRETRQVVMEMRVRSH